MTKQTKIELVQINAALAAENAALRKEVADFEMAADLAFVPGDENCFDV